MLEREAGPGKKGIDFPESGRAERPFPLAARRENMPCTTGFKMLHPEEANDYKMED
jgi:hypothetical protein